MPLEHDHGSVVGLDHRTEVRPERAVNPLPAREVHASEAAADRSLTTPLGEVQVLFPAALEIDLPALGIREPDPIQLLDLHLSSCSGADIRTTLSQVFRGSIAGVDRPESVDREEFDHD
jgi:hypothetical protein